jgi:hypothetical protein
MQPDPSEIQKLKERVEELEKMHSGGGHYVIFLMTLITVILLLDFCC